MGKGKTDFCLLLFEIILDHFERLSKAGMSEAPMPEFATNFKVNVPDDVDITIKEFHHYSELERWAESGSSDDERWFIFDEASTELTAQSGANAQQVAEVFSPFVKKMRKCGINMIVIGHDRGDVHPAIRAIASFIDKESLKSASVYQGIKSREPHGHVMSISGIPETSWQFDTDDVADWEWDHEIVVDDQVTDDDAITEDEWQEWRNSRIVAIYGATDLSQRAVGKLFGVSQTTVSNILDDAKKDEIEVEKAPANPQASAD